MKGAGPDVMREAKILSGATSVTGRIVTPCLGSSDSPRSAQFWLHSENITVMGGRVPGAEGRVQGDEGLRFALVDCSGILPLLERPRLSLVPSLAMPKRCGRRCWPLFSTEFRTQQWRAVELMENLMKECIRMENKEMKKEAMAGSFKRQALPPAAFRNTRSFETL